MSLKPLGKAAQDRVQRALKGTEGALGKLKTPLELHYLAWEWNWDDGFEPLQQVVSDPRCDRGTALLIYWHANPGWFCQYASRDEVLARRGDIEMYDFLKEIEGMYVGGFYKERNIRFDPRNDRGIDWLTENDVANCRGFIPQMMLEPSPGDEPRPWHDLFIGSA